MLDIKLLRENPAIVKNSQKKRGQSTKPIDETLALDKKWRSILEEVEKLKHQRNQVNIEIASQKKSGKDAKTEIEKSRKLASQIEKKDKEAQELRNKRNSILITIPNILHESVPKGKDETDNKEIKRIGKPRKFSFKPKDHIDLGLALDLFDIEKAANASGARFYYLKNEGALLEMALTHFALKELVKNGFTPIIPPNLVRERVMFGVGMLPMSREEIYKIDNEDLYLILTSEHAIAGLHMDEILEAKDLPKRYTAFSPCYRTEAGAHGRDTKGIFRVHQFDKVEMFIFCKPENSWDEHELLLKNAENLVKKLELPHRVMNICTGDIGYVAAKKYDLDAWLPGQNQYREIISCSNCTDYQARRLNARYREKSGDKPQIMHTLNSTALALGRTIVAILENYQNADGSITVPKVLQPYMGIKKIQRKA